MNVDMVTQLLIYTIYGLLIAIVNRYTVAGCHGALNGAGPSLYRLQ